MPAALEDILDRLSKGRRRRQEEDAAQQEPEGLLSKIGSVLDYPGRKVREFVSGKENASGRDVLEKLGVLSPNQEGFDAGDVAGFLGEVALDPLTYLGGVGALTKGGKAVSALEKIQPFIRATTKAKELATSAAEGTRYGGELETLLKRATGLEKAAKAEGVPLQMAKGLGAQAGAKQRALLSAKIPFTGVEFPLVRGERTLGALGKVGGKIGGLGPVQELRKLFSTAATKDPELEAYKEVLLSRPTREALARAGGRSAAMEGNINELAAKLGVDPEELHKQMVNAIETPGGVGQAPPELRGILSGTKGGLETGFQEQVASGARSESSRLQSEIGQEYFPRVKTAEELAAKKREPLSLESRLGRKVSTKEGSQIAREEGLRDVPTTETNAGFNVNPAQAVNQRLLAGERSTAAAKYFHGVLEDFAEPMGPHTINHAEAVAQAPLHGPIAEKLAKMGEKGLGIDRELWDKAKGVYDRLVNPEQKSQLLATYDKATQALKLGLTRWRPSFYIRNLAGDTMRSWMEGGANPSLIARAFKEARDPAAISQYAQLGLLHGTETAQILEQIGRTAAKPGLVDKLPGAAQTALKKLGDATQVQERFGRIWHYLSMKAKGLSDPEALDSVKKALFDYSDLTDFEKKVMGRAVLFYSYIRKSTPFLLHAAQEAPGRFAGLSRLTTQPSQQDNTPLPEFVRQSGAVRVGSNEAGDPRFLFGFGSPLEEINRFDPTSREGGVLGGLGTLLRRSATNLNPALRVPMELATGKELYFNRPIIEGDRAPAVLGSIPGLREAAGYREEKLPGGGIRPAGDPYALYLLNQLPPFSPGLREVGNLGNAAAALGGGAIDPRKRPGQSLLQAITGVKVASVDKQDQLRAVLEKLKAEATALQRTGEAGRTDEFFAKGPKGEKSAKVQELLKQQRAVRELLQKLREAGR